MKPIRSFVISLFIASTVAFAQGERYVTITVKPSGQWETNQVAISETETAEVVTHFRGDGEASFEKDGLRFYNVSSNIVVHGPAVFRLRQDSQNSQMLLTLKITPDGALPGNTVIIPGDTKGANIIMESSRDLVVWTDAAPGVYSNPTSHMFFRVRAERIQ